MVTTTHNRLSHHHTTTKLGGTAEGSGTAFHELEQHAVTATAATKSAAVAAAKDAAPAAPQQYPYCFLLGSTAVPLAAAELGATFSAPFCRLATALPPLTTLLAMAAVPAAADSPGRLDTELLLLLVPLPPPPSPLLVLLASPSLLLALLLRELRSEGAPPPLLLGAGISAPGAGSGSRLLRAMACRRPNSCFLTTSKAFSSLSSSSVY